MAPRARMPIATVAALAITASRSLSRPANRLFPWRRGRPRAADAETEAARELTPVDRARERPFEHAWPRAGRPSARVDASRDADEGQREKLARA
eukprot:820343-Pleurochrysis_carterae.AAC.1